ncbi:MAG TPA: GNAT family N-acetyltransferase [Puia sp.]|nr:GNAT family N-acetyltransferase [Puia sp.]
MSIRLAKNTDAPDLSRLLTQLDYPGTETFIAAKLGKILADPAERLLVWAEGEHVLGFLSLHFHNQLGTEGDFAIISYFAVDEAAQSKGIGAQLEAAATRLAQEHGCDRIVVHCHTRRTRAHAFYYRQGYEESPKYLIKRLS